MTKRDFKRGKDGVFRSTCGRFTIEKVFGDRYELRDGARGESSLHKRLCDAKSAADRASEPPTWPLVLDAYGDCRPRFGSIHYSDAPSCFNGDVRVVRYKITIEPVDEPEAIKERLKLLWRSTNNWHHREPLLHEAKRRKVELNPDEFGADVKAKKA